MNIEKVANGLKIHVDWSEAVDYFLKQALKQVKNKKQYIYGTAYARSFRIDVSFIEVPLKRTVQKRDVMLKKASGINLREFIEEFRATSNKENKHLVSRFCNIFKHCSNNDSLASVIKFSKYKYLPVGKSSDLFEQFLVSKDFAFAN